VSSLLCIERGGGEREDEGYVLFQRLGIPDCSVHNALNKRSHEPRQETQRAIQRFFPSHRYSMF